jgi:DNA-binding PadR family transcriptional regulator
MSKPGSLGEFEMMVMAALNHLGDEAYGVPILDEIQGRSGREVSIGALYATLARLEKKGLVKSRLGGATAERGGRAKRYYTPTTEGSAALQRSAEMLSSMLTGLPGWKLRGAE